MRDSPSGVWFMTHPNVNNNGLIPNKMAVFRILKRLLISNRVMIVGLMGLSKAKNLEGGASNLGFLRVASVFSVPPW